MARPLAPEASGERARERPRQTGTREKDLPSRYQRNKKNSREGSPYTLRYDDEAVEELDDEEEENGVTGETGQNPEERRR